MSAMQIRVTPHNDSEERVVKKKRLSPAQLTILYWCWNHGGRVSFLDRVKMPREALVVLVNRKLLVPVDDQTFETTELARTEWSFAPLAPPAAERHGTRACHERGCRCAPCRQAHNLYQQGYARRKSS